MSAPMVRSRSDGAEVAHRRPRRERRVRWPTPSPPLTLTLSPPLPALAAPTMVRCDGVQVPRLGSARPRPVAHDQTTAVGGQRHAMEPSCNALPIHRNPIQTRACSHAWELHMQLNGSLSAATWEPCNATCDSGIRTRDVSCALGGNPVPPPPPPPALAPLPQLRGRCPAPSHSEFVRPSRSGHACARASARARPFAPLSL